MDEEKAPLCCGWLVTVTSMMPRGSSCAATTSLRGPSGMYETERSLALSRSVMSQVRTVGRKIRASGALTGSSTMLRGSA